MGMSEGCALLRPMRCTCGSSLSQHPAVVLLPISFKNEVPSFHGFSKQEPFKAGVGVLQLNPLYSQLAELPSAHPGCTEVLPTHRASPDANAVCVKATAVHVSPSK